jgi:hypothetical protein
VNCEYGKFCSFAHSEEDISIELIHNLEYDDDFFMFYYKTVWCPYNLTQHDKVEQFRFTIGSLRVRPQLAGFQAQAAHLSVPAYRVPELEDY